MMTTERDTISLGELTRGATLSCIDGRHDHGIIGAPGGNMGEFLLLLTALESVEPALDDGEVASMLDGYLREFGRFYMHTDRRALDWIAEQLGRDRIEAETIEEAPRERRAELLELLTDPRGVGCGHINAMLNDPDAYQVRPELIRAAIRAFFDEIWNYDTGADLDYVVLEGDHAEEELVVYEADNPDELDDDTRVPLASTDQKRFVLHDVARRYLLRRSIDYFVAVRELDADQAKRYRERIEELGDLQLEATRDALFPDLPTHVVQVETRAPATP